MDSSSDESFVWTKASSGSDDSDEMNSSCDNEKSQQVTKLQIKQEVQESTTDQSSKKRKRQRESNDFDEVENQKHKKIKKEPESDIDTLHSKNTYHGGSFDQEDDYLNMLVKQERQYRDSENHEKSKKRNKQDKMLNENLDNSTQSSELDTHIQYENKHKKKKKKKTDSTEYDESLINEVENNKEKDTSKIKIKSPKRNKSKHSRLSDENELNGEVEANTTVEKIVASKNKSTDSILNSNNPENNKEKRKSKKNHFQNSVDNNIDDDNHSHSYHNNGNINDSLYEESKNQSRVISPRVPRLSDRIKFEDDIMSDTQLDSLIFPLTNNLIPSNLKRFLRENSKMQDISKSSNNSLEITDDDEIWILNCPHDVDINKLKNSDVNLDSKSKIKINGETYCGNLEDNSKINLMSSSKNGFKIKSLVPNGILKFRKRLPKPNFYKDNFMANNQTDFIPLPETKCRHPLFGSNYKDALNVRITRLAQFNSEFNSSFSEMTDKKKKKKHKKEDKDIEIKLEYDSESTHKKYVKEESEIPVKKSKKRKHTNCDENSGKKKRRKLEPDSAEAWESEKAIEENLFSF